MAATVAAGETASVAIGVAEAWCVVTWSWASLRSFLRILILSCIAETKRFILESACSSRIFSILRAAAATSSSVRHPNFCTSAASGRSNAPRNASIA